MGENDRVRGWIKLRLSGWGNPLPGDGIEGNPRKGYCGGLKRVQAERCLAQSEDLAQCGWRTSVSQEIQVGKPQIVECSGLPDIGCDLKCLENRGCV